MEPLITENYWKEIMFGVAMMILSSIFAALQSSVAKWGTQMTYIPAVILILRGSMQFVLCIVESIVSPKLHLIKDIKAIGIVPKRTIIPIFNERDMKNKSLQNINYGSFQPTTSYSQLTTIQSSQQTKYKTFYVLIWSAVILRGVFGGLNVLFIFTAVSLLPVGDVQALVALSAVFTPFMAFLCFKDTITTLHWMSLLGAIIGVVFIIQPSFIFREHPNGNYPISGYLYVISSAFTMSLTYICIQFARKVPVYILIISQAIWSVIMGFIVLFVQYNWTEIKQLEWIDSYMDVVFVLLLGVVSYLVLWLLTKSGQYISSGVIALLSNLSIVWGYLLQCVMFKSIPSWLTIAGALCMFTAAIIVSVDKISDARKKSMSVIQRNITTNPMII